MRSSFRQFTRAGTPTTTSRSGWRRRTRRAQSIAVLASKQIWVMTRDADGAF
ncbi:hypothetical protein ACFZDK_50850 [Streptomyces sp. NPDC007901]|uniref:hypothetical protein n=1 Tax=Streptomyces sp. NPDC007901 TaxID=3364785 RepID=UPI0036E51CA9